MSQAATTSGKLTLEVLTPTRRLIGPIEVDEVQAPGQLGGFGVLPGHASMVALLESGVGAYRVGGERREFVIDGGFAEIANNRMLVLAEGAETADALDLAGARKALERAKAHEASIAKDAAIEVKDDARAAVRLAEQRLAAREQVAPRASRS